MTLKVENLAAGYGPIQALQDVSLSVGRDEIVALIGSNGAGKTTMLRVISGLVRPRRGHVLWQETLLNGLEPHEIVARGVAQVPEGRHVFNGLTVHENLLMGAFCRRNKISVGRNTDRVLSIFPRLAERLGQMAGTLSGGEQQMLAVGRALMSSPELLLLDEPSMGLGPIVAERIFEVISEIAKDGTSILLVEQNLEMAFQVAHRAYALQNGIIVREGSVAELRGDSALRDAYLGGGVKTELPGIAKEITTG